MLNGVETTRFLVEASFDLVSRDALLVAGELLRGRLESGTTLVDERTGRSIPIRWLELETPRQRGTDQFTIAISREYAEAIVPGTVLASRRIDIDRLIATPLHFDIDPAFNGWLRAESGGEFYYLRINPAFPAAPLHGMPLTPDHLMDFDFLPAAWTCADHGYVWPATAAILDYDDDRY